MDKPDLRAGFDELLGKLQEIIRDGVDNVGPDGIVNGKKVAPAAYFATALKAYHALGMTATDDQANSLAAEIAAATGQKFTPKLVTDDEVEDVA